jgi:hypothetical protein
MIFPVVGLLAEPLSANWTEGLDYRGAGGFG